MSVLRFLHDSFSMLARSIWPAKLRQLESARGSGEWREAWLQNVSAFRQGGTIADAARTVANHQSTFDGKLTSSLKLTSRRNRSPSQGSARRIQPSCGRQRLENSSPHPHDHPNPIRSFQGCEFAPATSGGGVQKLARSQPRRPDRGDCLC